MIGRLGDLLRRALQTNERQEIAVKDEVETLRTYLSFVEARFGDRVQCRLEIDPSANDVAIPTFLLQPLVENAVQHGAAIDEGDTSILIALTRSADRLTVVVENDVDDVRTGPPRNGTGLGTTRDRLQVLYGDAATFSAKADHGRFRVQIAFPARPLAAVIPTTDASAYASADR
jgi:LytS/YehU family sensor histidine kinase